MFDPKELGTEVTGYVDLRIFVDTEPDNNHCVWFTIQRPFCDFEYRFDLPIEYVVRMRDALNQAIENDEQEMDYE